MSEEHTAAVLLELRRIGVDLSALPSRLVGTGLRASDLLQWLRAIPDDAGVNELLRRLEDEARTTCPPVEYRWRKDPPWPASLGRRERWWPTQALLDAGTDLLAEEWDPFGVRLAGTDRETVATFAFYFFGPLLAPNGHIDPITHTTEMIASAERDHLALEPSPEPHRRYVARRLRELLERHPVPPAQRPPPSGLVVIGDPGGPPALDPEGVCVRCHRFGTVARLTTMTVPSRVERFCSACWDQVRAERSLRPKGPETASERIAWLDAAHRPPTSGESRSWADMLDALHHFTAGSAEADPERQARFTSFARHLLKMEPGMDGPMPPEIEAFVQRYTLPDA